MAGVRAQPTAMRTPLKVGTLQPQLAQSPLRPFRCIVNAPRYIFSSRYPASSKSVYASQAIPEGAEGSRTKVPARRSRPLNNFAGPSLPSQGPTTKQQLAVRESSRKMVITQAAADAAEPPAPMGPRIILKIFTGRERDAGINGEATVTLVSKDGKMFPAKPAEPIAVKGPLRYDQEAPALDPIDLPANFEVAGVILDNVKEEQTIRQALGWLADFLNIDIPLVRENLLDFIIGFTRVKWLTNGDWYVSRVELFRVPGGSSASEAKSFAVGDSKSVKPDQVFPLYGWIEDSTQRIAFDGTSYLPQNTPGGLGKWRRGNLLVNQNAYNFQPYNDLSSPANNKDWRSPGHRPTLDPYPQHVQSDREGPNAFKLPRDERFGLSKADDFNTGTLQGVADLLFTFLKDTRIRNIILGSLLVGAAAGFGFRYLANEGVSEGFLVWADDILRNLIPEGVLRDLFGGLPVAALLAALAHRWVPGNALSGAALGELIGVVAGRMGAQAAGLVAGLLGFAIVFVALLKWASPLRFETVGAYEDACFGIPFKLGSFTIGYKRPFVYDLSKKPDDPTKEWKTDFLFGWQTVAGINPESITRVESEADLLATKTLTATDLAKVKLELPSFDDELAKGKIYIVNFSLLEEFMEPFNAKYREDSKSATKYLYAPVVILRQNDDVHHGVPVPIAIKLASSEQEIITFESDKSEDKWGWILAKAIASSANSGVHQLVQHFLRTHAICETYGIAMRRQLSELHPLFKLLIFHTRYTMDINNRARQSLINANGVIESTFSPGPFAMQASAAAYRGWRFGNENPISDLEQRGVLDERFLPNYPYREHAVEVWDAIVSYVRGYVALYYGSENDIANDWELQAFWSDVKRAHSSLDTWLKMEDPEHRAGLEWPALKTIEDLVHILSTIIWTGSAMHSAVNFGQYDYSAFVPNAPASIGRKLDYEKLRAGTYTERDFMAAMPVATEMTQVMTVVSTLVKHSKEEQYLGIGEGLDPGWEFADFWFIDSKADDIYSKFVTRISDAQQKLEGLNKKAEGEKSIQYFYLLPHPAKAQLGNNIPAQGVPNSVTI